MFTVTFDELESALAGAGAPMPAAEAHGVLTAALAAVPGYAATDWIAELALGTEREAAAHAMELLEVVYDETREALSGIDMDFEPLLPDDEQPLETRVRAIAAWAAGFLYGLGASQVAAADELPGDVTEILRDFAEVSRAVVDADETPESSEASYVEVVEYLRAGAQLVFESFWAHRDEVPRP
jgi:hypothetical protein